MRACLVIMGLLLLVGIAAGYTENFQNDVTDVVKSSFSSGGWGSGGTATVVSYGTDTSTLVMKLAGGAGPGIQNTEALSANSWAFTSIYLDPEGYIGYHDPAVYLLDSGGGVIGGFSLTFDTTQRTRIKIDRVGTTLYQTINGGTQTSLGSCGATQPYYFVVIVRNQVGGSWYVDDITYGTSITDVVGLPPHTWFVGADLLESSTKGLFDSSYNNIYQDHFFYTISNSTGTAVYNYSMPDPPTSGTITITSGAASDYITARSVVLSGTNITWSSSTYAANDLAGLNWTITSQYWDTTLYDYKFKVYEYTNGTTTLKQTTAINTANGTGSYQTTTDGVYTAALILDYKTAPNTDFWLDSDFMEVLQGIKIIGTVYDAFNRTPINASTVYCAQATTNESTSSNVTGGYTCPFTMSTGLTSTFTCNKVNYTTDVFSYTFTKPGTYYVDMNLLPYNGTSAPVVDGQPIWNGTAIYGLTISTPYNYAVPGATVTLSDGNNTTSSTTGYYHFDNVLANTSYTLTGTKTGYADATTSVVTGSDNTGTRADLVFAEGFTVTVYVRDTKTGGVTTNASTVCVSTTCQNTAGGVTAFALPYGTYTVSATCHGYEPGSSVGRCGGGYVCYGLPDQTD